MVTRSTFDAKSFSAFLSSTDLALHCFTSHSSNRLGFIEKCLTTNMTLLLYYCCDHYHPLLLIFMMKSKMAKTQIRTYRTWKHIRKMRKNNSYKIKFLSVHELCPKLLLDLYNDHKTEKKSYN